MWYLYIFASLLYFALNAKADFYRLQACLFIGMGLCLAFYAVFPNAISFRPEITQTDLLSRAMAAMFRIDTSTMVLPSMHVFAAAAIHISLIKSQKTGHRRLLLALSLILAILICASTVFIKQHSVIDVLCGLLLALALYFPVYRKARERQTPK